MLGTINTIIETLDPCIVYSWCYLYSAYTFHVQLDHCEENLEDPTEFRSIVAGHLIYNEKAPFDVIRMLIAKCVKGRK